MQFVVTVRGVIKADVDVYALGIDISDPHDFLDVSRDVDLRDVRLVGTVSVEATVSISGIEVEAVDLASFDADECLRDRLGLSYDDVSFADFDIVKEPTGFRIVEAALGYSRDDAIRVYAELSQNGLEVIGG